jgi:hypothetical protein
LARTSTAATPVVELCWTLVGRRQGRVWLARRMRRSRGERASVRFDGLWVLQREESRHDVVGFLHTHPDGPSAPSFRDMRTMQAWCTAFGKPLLCFIESPAGLHGYCFAADAAPIKLAAAERFPRGVIIGVEADGR